IQQAEELGGEDAQNIIERSQSQLPQIYYQIAIGQYKDFQQEKTMANLESTIEAFLQTEEIASEYNETETAKKAANVVTQLLYSKSLIQYQQDELEKAIATLNNVIERNPNYAKAYYQKALVVKNLDSKDFEEAISLFDKAISVGNSVNAAQIVRR